MKAMTRTPMRVPKTPRAAQAQMPTEKRRDLSGKQQDPVNVFCRVRPLQSDGDLTCLRVKNSTTIAVNSQDQLMHHKQNGAQREIQYIFKHVFQPDATQQDVFTSVAQPLVENLVRGRNSLLFTYGVTSSGKTYTMTGNSRHRRTRSRSRSRSRSRNRNR